MGEGRPLRFRFGKTKNKWYETVKTSIHRTEKELRTCIWNNANGRSRQTIEEIARVATRKAIDAINKAAQQNQGGSLLSSIIGP